MTDREVVEKWRQKMLECWAQGLDVFMTALLEDGPQYQESEWKPAKIGKITYDGKDPADDGPEVSILRQSVAQVKKQYGVYMNLFGSGEEVQSLSLPEIYSSKKKATEAINKYLKSFPQYSDYNYHVKEIL